MMNKKHTMLAGLTALTLGIGSTCLLVDCDNSRSNEYQRPQQIDESSEPVDYNRSKSTAVDPYNTRVEDTLLEDDSEIRYEFKDILKIVSDDKDLIHAYEEEYDDGSMYCDENIGTTAELCDLMFDQFAVAKYVCEEIGDNKRAIELASESQTVFRNNRKSLAPEIPIYIPMLEVWNCDPRGVFGVTPYSR